jgi:phosphoglycolate phosphatase-like HAD superfamily hydrolase
VEPRLILFDVDGTLVDTQGAGRRAMERACAALFGVDGVATKAAGVEFAGRTDPRIIEAVVEAIGIARERYLSRREELHRRFLSELGAQMRRSVPGRRVLPGVLPLLGALRERGAWLGLVTGNLEEGARAKLEPFGLNPIFPAGGFSSDHPDRREIARIAWRRLSDLAATEFPPSRVTVVGDTEHDVDCARANGFRAVAVAGGFVPRERLAAANPDALLDDFTDLPAALRAILAGEDPPRGGNGS